MTHGIAGPHCGTWMGKDREPNLGGGAGSGRQSTHLQPPEVRWDWGGCQGGLTTEPEDMVGALGETNPSILPRHDPWDCHRTADQARGGARGINVCIYGVSGLYSPMAHDKRNFSQIQPGLWKIPSQMLNLL